MLKSDKYEIVSELARRRGFFWPSYEIYGGASGFITYGPLGTLLKQKIEEKIRNFLIRPLNILEMESSIITPAKVFEASGHVKAFREPMVECLKCNQRFRADHLLQEQTGLSDTQTEKLNLHELGKEIITHRIKCPECEGKLSLPRYFMTMFKTTIGPYSKEVGYGRPEAAQGIFVEFKRLYETNREKLPLGIIQMGHALRNEISPRQGPVRLREFNIADLEFFFDPENPKCSKLKEITNTTLHLIPAPLKKKEGKKAIEVTVKEALQKAYIKTEWQAYFMVLAKHLLSELGIPADKQRFIEKLPWERAHYSAQGYDQEIYFNRWGWTEISGHNYRTDYDLRQHMKHSGVDMRVFKKHEKPITVRRRVLEPVLTEIGPVFKNNASKVIALLSEANAEEVEKSLDQNGYYIAGSFKILPIHVKITYKEVEETGRRFIPHVVEPSFGIDRLVYAALEFAYDQQKDRVVLRLPREIAPIQVAVFPLVSKDGLAEKAKEVYVMLREGGFMAEYDEAGSIGRRYARADEVGIPLCITIDYQTLENKTVTIRERDSWKQTREKINALVESLQDYLNCKANFADIGDAIEK
ncbi:MAG: glycine--tRNA ligase [Candidatus Bathyarchaeota archaeon]|nr:MAG: glycine--tRNA ligase [Candidatus Bathyarchaeota archaeon]